MKARNALREFERLLEARGITSSEVSARDGIEAMLDFYRDTRADDCSVDEDGDMLLFQWGTRDCGHGPELEVDITRQLIPGDGKDDDIYQLSLTFFFPPRQLASGDRWCQAPDELDELAAFVRTHEVYAAVAESRPDRVELDYERVG